MAVRRWCSAGHRRGRLLSSVSVADTSHEGLQRGDEPWTGVSGGNGWPIDTEARIAGYVRQHGRRSSWTWSGGSSTPSVGRSRALADAGVNAADIAWWVFPNMGRSLTDWDARASIGVDLERTTWPWAAHRPPRRRRPVRRAGVPARVAACQGRGPGAGQRCRYGLHLHLRGAADPGRAGLAHQRRVTRGHRAPIEKGIR
ncbi:hypothetical protein NKG94_27025 [Micromonospora sp. M12]